MVRVPSTQAILSELFSRTHTNTLDRLAEDLQLSTNGRNSLSSEEGTPGVRLGKEWLLSLEQAVQKQNITDVALEESDLDNTSKRGKTNNETQHTKPTDRKEREGLEQGREKWSAMKGKGNPEEGQQRKTEKRNRKSQGNEGNEGKIVMRTEVGKRGMGGKWRKGGRNRR